MRKKMDSRTKGLLWFLFQPEKPPGAGYLEKDRRHSGYGLAAGSPWQELLKSAVWIMISILLSLTLAHLK